LSKLFSSKLNNCLNIAQSHIYPFTCFICNQAGHNSDLCHACSQDLHQVEQTCPICDIELTTDSNACGRCLKTTPHFDKITSLYRYEGTAAFLIQSLKFKAQHSCAKIMGELMADHMANLNKQPDALMAVPLHPKRLRERGFNQSHFLTEYLKKHLNIPDHSDCLTRIVNTSSQSSLKAPERRSNIKNAFRYEPIKGINSVAIIDDVVTTGSTADEIAKTLKSQGVERVEIWAFARA